MRTAPTVDAILAAAITAAVFAVAFRARASRLHVAWFLDYLRFLVCYYLASLSGQILTHLGYAFLGLAGAAANLRFYYFLQAFVVVPLTAFFLFHWTRCWTTLTGRTLGARFRTAYAGVAGLTVAGFMIVTLWAMTRRNSAIFTFLTVQDGVTAVVIVALLALPFWAAIRSRSTATPAFAARVLRAAWLQAAGLAGAGVFLILVPNDEQIGHHLARFVAPIPVFLSLLRLSNLSPSPAAAETRDGADLDALSARIDVTPREREIIALVCQGRTSPEIGAELFISVKTVKQHLYNIYRKLGVRNRVEMVNLVNGTSRGGAA